MHKKLNNDEEQSLPELPDFPNQKCMPYKEGITGYIGGYIVRSMIRGISCDVCAEELLLNKNESTYKLSGFYESLLFVKDRGGFTYTFC